jgi:hypothetical protein
VAKREPSNVFTLPGMLLINAYREEALLFERDGKLTSATRLRALASKLALTIRPHHSVNR